METAVLSDFLALADRVDANKESVASQFLSFRREEGELCVYQGQDRLGQLTPRAEKNLATIARVNPGLIATLPEDTLNAALRFQLADLGNLGIIRDPENEASIISFVEDTRAYLRYQEVLDGIPASELTSFRGNIITDDKISFMKILGRMSPKDGKEVLIGLYANVSSTGNAQSKASYGTYRLICSNGLIDPCFCEDTLRTSDPRLIQAVFGNYFQTLNTYTGNLAKIIERAENTVPDRNRLDEYLSLVSLPTAITKAFKETIYTDNAATLREAGVDTKDTLWDWVNIMSHLAKGSPAINTREATERKLFEWMSSFYKILN